MPSRSARSSPSASPGSRLTAWPGRSGTGRRSRSRRGRSSGGGSARGGLPRSTGGCSRAGLGPFSSAWAGPPGVRGWRAPALPRGPLGWGRGRAPRTTLMSGPTLYVVLVAFGVVVGVASGLLGVGGGTLIVPFLTLAAGFSQHSAEATSLLVILPTAIVGSLALRSRGVGNLGLALRFGVVGAVASVLGALLALALPAMTLRLVFAVFVGGVGLKLAYDGLRGDTPSTAGDGGLRS